MTRIERLVRQGPGRHIVQIRIGQLQNFALVPGKLFDLRGEFGVTLEHTLVAQSPQRIACGGNGKRPVAAALEQGSMSPRAGIQELVGR